VNTAIVTRPHLADALGNALAVYDRGTFEHSDRITRHARQLGQALGLDTASLEVLGWAGALHDLGKLAVPEEVLQKGGALTRTDRTFIKAHPAVGYEMLMAVSSTLLPVAQAVRSHHERWDGSGYPDGLVGEDIPLLGRILALTDVYDALTHTRSYRPSVLSAVDAQEVIALWSGTHFDPALVPLYLDVLSSQPEERAVPDGTDRLPPPHKT